MDRSKDRQLYKMAHLIESLETLLYDACKLKGWKWVHEEPLWSTWTLEKFGMKLNQFKFTYLTPLATELPRILSSYQRELHELKDLVVRMRPHSTPFEQSRQMLAQWVAQPFSRIDSWTEWEDLCAAEVERWDTKQ